MPTESERLVAEIPRSVGIFAEPGFEENESVFNDA